MHTAHPYDGNDAPSLGDVVGHPYQRHRKLRQQGSPKQVAPVVIVKRRRLLRDAPDDARAMLIQDGGAA